MKKFLPILLGLSLVSGTAILATAQETKEPAKTEKQKKETKKKPAPKKKKTEEEKK